MRRSKCGILRKMVGSGLAAMILVSLAPTISWAWQGKVLSVIDGDTLTVARTSKGERVRLYGVDCPEKNQDSGERARQFTMDMLLGKEVEVVPVSRDNRGYPLAIIKLGDLIFNRKLVEAGLAWVDMKACYRKECPEWSRLQDQAQESKVGLWAAPGPIPPWELRTPVKKATRSPSKIKGGEVTAIGQPPEIYHGDVVNHIFHAPGCRDFNCKNCIAVFKSKDAAKRAGYKPCEVCNP